MSPQPAVNPDAADASLQAPRLSIGMLAVGLLVLGSFAWLPISYYRMVGWPWILIWQLGFLLLGIWLVARLRQFQQPFQRLGWGLDWLVGLTFLGLSLSSLLAQFRPVALWHLSLVLCYGLLLYILRNGVRPGELPLRSLWRAIAIAIVGSAVISLAYWRPDPAMWQSGDFASAIRNHQPLGHHNFVGGYLALGVPLVLSLAITERGVERWLAGLGVAIAVFALYVSGSRGAALGLLVWLIVTLVLKITRSRGRQRRRYSLFGAILLVLALLGLSTNPRVRDTLGGLMAAPSWDLRGLASADGPLVDRLFMAQAGLNLFRDHPLLGIGPGNMSRLYNLYRPLETGNGLDHVQQLHNTPVHLLGELGILGLGLYLAWIIGVGRLGWRLHRRLATAPGDRPEAQTLLFGIGGSFLAYGVSSLTDYQLENIPISLTLVVNITLLMGLADQAELAPSTARLPQAQRRLGSLGVAALLALVLRIWMPFDASLALGDAGFHDLDEVRVAQAYPKWLKASQLAPWDPTFAALSAEKLIEIEPLVASAEDRTTLTESILESLWAAYQAAPNDAWFNHNLAVRLMPEDPAAAEVFASRTVSLLPRNLNYTYHLLGVTYLAQEQRSRAIIAFALEGLLTPDYTAMPLWQAAPFSEIYPAVVDDTLALYDALLSRISPQQALYSTLYERAQLLRWWHQRPLLPPQDAVQLRPMAKAVLSLDDPNQALAILNRAIATEPEARSLLMLRAWIDPDTYLEDLLTLARPDNEAEAKAATREHILKYRQLRPWLTSVVGPLETRTRQALAFAYRNRDANQITLMLRPETLRPYTLVDVLALFPNWPREFPALDQLAEEVKAAELGLVHPTQNHFQLPAQPDASRFNR